MSSSQPENYTRNVVSNFVNAAVLVVVGFVATPLLTHHLGVVRYGVWALIGSLIPYFELLELGFANSTISYVARHLESGDEELVHRTLNTSFFVLMVPGVLAAGLATVVAIFLPHIVHTIPPHLVNQARILLLLLAFDMVVSIPMDTFGGGLIALQRYDLLNATLVSVTVLQAVAWFIVLELHGGLVALGIVTVAIGLAGQLSRFLLLRHQMPSFRASVRGFDRTILRTFARVSGWFSLGEISVVIIEGVDLIIVGIVVGVRGAAIFAVGQRLGTLPGKLMTPPTDVVFPIAGQLAGRGDREGMRTINANVTRLVTAVAVPATLAIMVLSVPAIRAWVGPSFHQSAEVTTILAGAIIVQAISLTPRMVVGGSGRPKLTSVILAVQALAHIGLGIVLCQHFGVLGAAYTALIVAVALEGILLVPVLYKLLDMPLLIQLFRLLRSHVIPLLLSGAIGWALARWPVGTFVDHHDRPESIGVVIAAGLAVIVPYYLILYFTGMNSEERTQALASLQSRKNSLSRQSDGNLEVARTKGARRGRHVRRDG